MLKMFSVCDRVSETYINPFVLVTERDAIEGFRTIIAEEGNNYNKFPEDFDLVSVGQFDPQKGVIDSHEPKRIINGWELTTEQHREILNQKKEK